MSKKDKLIKELIDEGYLRSSALIEAFQVIDRREFAPENKKDEAYGNYPLPIGHGQTISQPLTVAFMLELLEPKRGEKILDIGCGSGWQTALLAYIVGAEEAGGKVIGIELIPELASMAEKNVAKFGFIEKGIAKIINADGSEGYEPEAPYDKIIAAAAGTQIPKAWREELKIGGRIVMPVKSSIYSLTKKSSAEFDEKVFFGFSFVPLIIGK